PICIFYSYHTHTTPPDIYTLSLHDALPISRAIPSTRSTHSDSPGIVRSTQTATCSASARHERLTAGQKASSRPTATTVGTSSRGDRKSTRLNSSHLGISYAVFCLKKKKNK